MVPSGYSPTTTDASEALTSRLRHQAGKSEISTEEEGPTGSAHDDGCRRPRPADAPRGARDAVRGVDINTGAA